VIVGLSSTVKFTMSQIFFLYVRSSSKWLETSLENLQEHPGGKQIILKYAGRDATAVYKPIHPEDALKKNLPKEKCLGSVSAAAKQQLESDESFRRKTKDETRVAEAQTRKLPLKRILTLQDMEVRLPQSSPHPSPTLSHRTLLDRFYRTRRTPTTLLRLTISSVSAPNPLYP